MRSMKNPGRWHIGGCTVVALLLGACASGPRPTMTTTPTTNGAASKSAAPVVAVPRPGAAPASERDGPEARPPADLASVPDAEPKIETIQSGGPNKPYEVLGQSYTPLTRDAPFTQRGIASWYGRKFHGRRTASGEVYDMYGMSAAHRTLPLPSYVRVRNPANGAEVVLRVNDRGPFHPNRIIDLSYTAAMKLGVLNGVAPVEVQRITGDDIRTGVWREGRPAETQVAQAARRAPAATANAATAAPAAPAVVTVPVEPALIVLSAAEPVPAAKPADPVLPALAASPPPQLAPAALAAQAALGFWVQLGAFQKRSGADSFHGRVVAELDWLAPVLAVVNEPRLFRLQAGPYGNRDEALDVARRVREALQLVPLVLERR